MTIDEITKSIYSNPTEGWEEIKLLFINLKRCSPISFLKRTFSFSTVFSSRS